MTNHTPGVKTEEERLRSFLEAISWHGRTVWPDSSCGRGGVGGQTLTTEYHGEVVDHLVTSALRGETLEEAAVAYSCMWPRSRRLDAKPARSRRAGPDGRPL